jgi:hypothetical protein
MVFACLRMTPQSIVCFNPDLLDEEEFWPVSCLSGLCKKLGISPDGDRFELISKLKQWHTTCADKSSHSQSAKKASNFHLLAVEECAVEESFLSPFKKHKIDGSILRKRIKEEDHSSPKRKSFVRKKPKKTVQFSPFNKVQVFQKRNSN